jgi:hypothetical protein
LYIEFPCNLRNKPPLAGEGRSSDWENRLIGTLRSLTSITMILYQQMKNKITNINSNQYLFHSCSFLELSVLCADWHWVLLC